MKRIKVTVEKSTTGFSAYTPDFAGVFSVGRTWQEVQSNFDEAFNLHLAGLQEDGELIPQNFRLEYCLDLKQFFEHYDVFNVSAFSSYLKINTQQLHQYKNGHKLPSEKTSEKILNGIHDFARELMSLE